MSSVINDLSEKEEVTPVSTKPKRRSASKRIKAIVDTPSFWKGVALVLFAVILLSQLFEITITPKFALLNPDIASLTQEASQAVSLDAPSAFAAEVLPAEGVALPINWGDLGKKMIADGVIDEEKFTSLFEGGLGDTEEKMLKGNHQGPVVMNEANSRFMLDILWAFGLANKNDILENGEMTDEKYGGDAGAFASTGGWTLAKGSGADHMSRHSYITLTPEQQALVDKVSRGIYRPCCGNSTHFPDCNHGIAMLGLLELMAKNGATEQEMFQVALKVNSFWFPQTYMDLAAYFSEQGTSWNKVDPKSVLGAEYSSSQGYQQTRQQIKSLPQPPAGGGGCGA